MFPLVTACMQHDQTSLQVNLNSASFDFYMGAGARAGAYPLQTKHGITGSLTSAEGHAGLLTSTTNSAVYLRLFA